VKFLKLRALPPPPPLSHTCLQVRNADVVANSDVECYELNRNVFLRSCGSLSELVLRQGKARLLKVVDLLSNLSSEEHTEIASMLKMHTFKKGKKPFS
jgi:hypothetical protein